MSNQTDFLLYAIADEAAELPRALGNDERYLAWRTARNLAGFAQLLADQLDQEGASTPKAALPASTNGNGHKANGVIAELSEFLTAPARSDEYKDAKLRASKAIAKARKQSGLSQTELAALCDLHPTVVNKIELGDLAGGSLQTRLDILQVLDGRD